MLVSISTNPEKGPRTKRRTGAPRPSARPGLPHGKGNPACRGAASCRARAMPASLEVLFLKRMAGNLPGKPGKSANWLGNSIGFEGNPEVCVRNIPRNLRWVWGLWLLRLFVLRSAVQCTVFIPVTPPFQLVRCNKAWTASITEEPRNYEAPKHVAKKESRLISVSMVGNPKDFQGRGIAMSVNLRSGATKVSLLG